MDKPKIRVNIEALDKLEAIKKENNLKSYASVIDYLLETSHDFKTTNNNFSESQIEEKISKILAGVNYNSKLLSLLEEFSNTVTDGLLFNENKNTTSDPSDWYKQAKVEVENKIQTKRTQALSQSKEDYNG